VWKHWSQLVTGSEKKVEYIDYIFYVTFTVLLATASSLLTMTTRTIYPGALQIQNVDEDLAQVPRANPESSIGVGTEPKAENAAPTVYYSAAGSGVAEVKVILSGFVLHVRSQFSI
jgi:chloride channel 3/4/5